MATFYLDTSALSKRYVEEPGSGWLRTLAASNSQNILMTARITMAEMYSALSRRKREGSVSGEAYETAARAFSAHCAKNYLLIELDARVIDRARGLLDRYPLRAYDAVQLASALVANQTLIDQQLNSLIFVGADDRLLQAAISEGLSIENPNLHL